MRALVFLLATLVALWGSYPAAAEENSAQTEAAGVEFYRALVLEGAALEMIFEILEDTTLPELRQRVLNSDAFRGASPDHQRALAELVNAIPSIVRNEFAMELENLADRVGPRFATLMTEHELEGASQFLRSPAMRPLWRDLMEAIAASDHPTGLGVFPDWSLTAEGRAFVATPPGRALVREEDNINRVLIEGTRTAFELAQPGIRQLLDERICDALAEDCPTHLRNSLGRT